MTGDIGDTILGVITLMGSIGALGVSAGIGGAAGGTALIATARD